MSRYIAAEWLENNAKEYSLGYYEDNEWATPLNVLDSAPSIDIPQWTPCSERLPSESGRYLVVYPMLIDKPWVDILWYGKPTFPKKDEHCFYASDDEYGDVEYSDVIAWMPLPTEYRGE